MKKEFNYFWLLGGLLITLLVAPFLADFAGEWLGAAYVATLLMGVISLKGEKRAYVTGWILALAMIATTLVDALTLSREAQLVNYGNFLLFSILATYYVLHSVLSYPTISLNQIAGALCVYFLIGLNFALLYAMVYALDPTAFSGLHDAASNERVLLDVIYFSFVTLTTLGYGDITPNSAGVQALAYLEAATGVIYLAVMIASLVSAYASEARRKS